jgi:uncharacterized protein (DUF885 family)
MQTIILLAGLLIAGCARAPAAGDSARLESLFDRYFRETLALCPEEAAELGLPREAGFSYDRSGFNDYSDQGIGAQYRLMENFRRELTAIDPAKLSPPQRVDRKSLLWLLKTSLEGKRYWHHRGYLSHLYGVHMQVLSLMTDYHGVQTREDADGYLKRLETLPRRLGQARQIIEKQAAGGKLPPRYIIDRTIGSMSEFRNVSASDNLMVTSFGEKLDKVEDWDRSEAQDYLERARLLVERSVYPAYDSLLAAARQARERAPEDGGVWTMPDGDKYYRWCLKYYTTSDIDPEKLHQTGLNEVARLQAKAKKLLDSLGVKSGGGYRELMRAYWAEQQGPEFAKYFYSQDEKGREQALEDNKLWLEQAWKRLPDFFETLPQTAVEVRPVPAHKAGGGTSYYEPGSADGQRTAAYYLNMTQVWPKFTMQPTLYHETVPGHHLQIAIQQQQSANRMYRNLFFLAGFGEGWAMYAQALADEQGWLPDAYTRLAEINSQLFRAVRIVMDTGIHGKRWSKRRAMEYMEENLGWASENEVDRYIVWPGQACSYTLGKHKIMELRSLAQKEMGARFELKKFHSAVLGHGSIPLEVLGEVVDDFIKGH